MDDHSVRGPGGVQLPEMGQASTQAAMPTLLPSLGDGLHVDQSSNLIAIPGMPSLPGETSPVAGVLTALAGITENPQIPTIETLLGLENIEWQEDAYVSLIEFASRNPSDPLAGRINDTLANHANAILARGITESVERYFLQAVANSQMGSDLATRINDRVSPRQEEEEEFFSYSNESYETSSKRIVQNILAQNADEGTIARRIDVNYVMLMEIADNQGGDLAREINDALASRARTIIQEPAQIVAHYEFLTKIAHSHQGGDLAREINDALASRARTIIQEPAQIVAHYEFLTKIAHSHQGGDLARAINDAFASRARTIIQEPAQIVAHYEFLMKVAYNQGGDLVREINDALASRARTIIQEPAQIVAHYEFLTKIAHSHQGGDLARAINDAFASRARTILAERTQIEECREFLMKVAYNQGGHLAREIYAVIQPSYYKSVALLLDINRNEVKAHPQELLKTLIKKFEEKFLEEKFVDQLNIRFIDEPGTDSSGLSRQFIFDLFEALAEKLSFKEYQNGLFRPEAQQGMYLNSEDKEIFQNIGTLIMFCLNASASYPIGMVFDKGVYAGIQGFPDHWLDLDFETLADAKDVKKETFDTLFKIYAKMHEHNEVETRTVTRLRSYLDPWSNTPDANSMIETAYGLAEGYLPPEQQDLTDINDIRKHEESIKQGLRKFCMEGFLVKKLAPLHAMAQGMRRAQFQSPTRWQDVQKMNTDTLEETIQGTVTVEKILGKLTFQGVEESKQEWVKNWIKGPDDSLLKKDEKMLTPDEKILVAKIRTEQEKHAKMLKQFVYALTGSNGVKKPLLIDNTSGDKIIFHTCFNQLDFPFHLVKSEKKFKTFLEGTLTGAGYNIA